MACIILNCNVCADSTDIRQIKEQLPNEEMKHKFDDFMDRMGAAEEELQIQSIYAQGYQNLLIWYMALDDLDVIDNKDVYACIKFFQDWRDDIRDNFWAAMNAHVWGPK